MTDRLPHERDLDIRKHLATHHGHQHTGSVRLATYLRHRALHARTGLWAKHTPTIPHTHQDAP